MLRDQLDLGVESKDEVETGSEGGGGDERWKVAPEVARI